MCNPQAPGDPTVDLGWCVRGCDPLAPDCGDPAAVCDFVVTDNSGEVAETQFLCIDGGGLEIGAPCARLGACAAGAVCGPFGAEGALMCAQICAVDAPSCTDPNPDCVAVGAFGTGVGICGTAATQ